MKIIIVLIAVISMSIVGIFKNTSATPITGQDTIPCQEIIIKCTQSARGNYVIRSEKEYKDLLKIDSPYPDCASYQLPAIDFSQYTLIGIITSSAGCAEPKTECNILKNIDTDTYQVNLKIMQHGMCKINFSIDKWCLIPKIDDMANVEFIR